MQDSPRYVYLHVYNYSSGYGKYELYVHEIDLGVLLENALVLTGAEYITELIIREVTGTTDESSEFSQNNANRAAVGLVSRLQGKSLASSSEDLLINEIRREVSGGNSFISAFIANFGVSLIKAIYSKY
jgi:hypothetical protein